MKNSEGKRIVVRAGFGKSHPLYKKLLPYAENNEARERLIFLAMLGSEQLDKLGGHSTPTAYHGLMAPLPTSQAADSVTSPVMGSGHSQKGNDSNDAGTTTSSPPELMANAFSVDFMNDLGGSGQ